MRLIVSLFAIFLSINARAMPNGISTWRATIACDHACIKEGNREQVAVIVLIIKGRYVCGIADQDYGLGTGDKSPNGDFAGRIVNATAIVGFFDSFSSPENFGTAGISLSGQALRWSTIVHLPVGYLALDDFAFKRVTNASRSTEIAENRCEKFFTNQQQNDPVRDYLSNLEYR